MTRNEIVQAIMAKATETGLKSSTDPKGGCWIEIDSETRYATITVFETLDFNRCDIEKQIKAGHFEISAAVSRMGGSPDVDELLTAADQIRCAAEFVKACSKMELSYRVDADGYPT
ncbi:MAG: hypothetical protein IKR49_00075 [Clostridia bacterium]|nr:hypothetical protein [Clostridia bacterium]